MGSRIRPLLVWVLIAAWLQAGPASASGFNAGSNVAGFLGGLGLLPEPPEALSEALEWWDRVEKAQDILERAKICADAGLGSAACVDAVWAGACTMYLELALEAAPQFQILGLPIEEICSGEPTLKCCKYTADQIGCHTAFVDDEAINCEGNPSTPGKAYGPCVSINDPVGIGCTCCGNAGCVTDACHPASLSDPVLAAWRVDYFAKKIAGSFQSAARTDPAGAADFVTLVGCTAHRDAMLQIAPFAFPDSLPIIPDPGPSFHVNDNDPDDRYLRGLTTLAVRRVLGGIPNGIARWEAISGRLWTDAEIAAEVATVGDADAILGGLLGPFGLTVLRGADERHYKLLAVPLTYEPPGANISPYVAGCVPGQPPSVGIQLSVADNSATVQLAVQDPLAARTPSGQYPVAVDWGDGRLEHVFLLSPSQQIVHSYAAAGTYAVRAWTVNAAGLVGSANTVAAVGSPAGPADPGPPTVASVALDLTAATFSYEPPHVSVATSAITPEGIEHSLGHLYASAPARAAGYATDRFAVPGTLAYFRATPVSELQLSATWGGGNVVSSVQVILGEVLLTGWDGAVTAVRPSPEDVQWLPAGAAYPISPLIDPATGGLLLPAGGEQIEVRLPSDGTPFAGCRPIYSPVTPVMVTANGGCQDQATGRIWSLRSPPATYAQAQTYCSGLTQGGVTGWRLPTDAELSSVAGAAKAGTFFAFPTSGVQAWSTGAWFGAGRVTRNLGTGAFGVTAETALAAAVCVR
ncbi:MAG TPA: hypothetical protein VLT87_09910 [Thermoanaerobaculia bacterium]|nr:hypothetical protein [Thermoanaerobaculia bacterium]